jgi:membrane-bound serine protease (ClpP class)
MRHLTIVMVMALGVLMPALAADPVVRLVEFETAITPLSAKRITQAIEDAEAAGDEFVLIELDTPGGLVFSMEEIVKAMLGAEVPIVVWVGPAGAQAASAGFFLLIAADVATMAPGTRTGAASTVFLGDSKEGDVHLKKSNEDLAALIRSIATRRGRNPQVCQEAVVSAKAWEETVALEQGLVDLIVQSRQELLEQLDGREIERFDGSVETLHTANATFISSTFDLKHRFMEFLAKPAIAVLLLLGGVLGIYIEFTHPGVVLPGVVGVLCLILFGLMAQVLPVSLTGVLLIALGIVMFILEIKVVSFGMLTLGGAACLVGGSLMLIDGPIPELRVPWVTILPTSIAVAVLCAWIVRLVVRARSAQVSTGIEGLGGKVGSVVEALNPVGKVFVHGELWNAHSSGGEIPEGTQVRVVGVDNLNLSVEALDD